MGAGYENQHVQNRREVSCVSLIMFRFVPTLGKLFCSICSAQTKFLYNAAALCGEGRDLETVGMMDVAVKTWSVYYETMGQIRKKTEESMKGHGTGVDPNLLLKRGFCTLCLNEMKIATEADLF